MFRARVDLLRNFRAAISFAVLAACGIAIVRAGRADDALSEEKEQKEQRSKHRLEIMKSAIDALAISADTNEAKSSLKFAPAPLLRYNDETRGFLDGTVWRLGETGRPRALVTIELYRHREGTALLTYEFFSLSPSRLSLDSTRNVRWAPVGTDLKIAPLPEAPAPADSAKTRLRQMRQLALRFAAREDHKGDKVECRLMPQPIDRYDDPARGIVDGAIFAFANGTNPEIGLLLESGKKEWSYGVLRLSAAAATLDLDGKQVYQQAAFNNYTVTSPYTSARHEVPLPE